MIESLDTSGLICGFRLIRGEPPQPLRWDQAVELADDPEANLWLHFNLADTRAQKWIGTCDRIPPGGRDILLDIDTHIRLEPVEKGIAGVLGDLHYEFFASEVDPDHLCVLRIYFDAHRVITGRGHPGKAVDRLRQDLRAGADAGTTLQLLTRLVEELAETFAAVTVQQAEVVNVIEDRVLKARFRVEGEELGRVRRLLARLRRHVGAIRQALVRLTQRPPDWFQESDLPAFLSAVERIEGVAQDLESFQERARLLQEETGRQLNEATNRNIYVLSLLTAIFLPITLITGIFGMNVGGLPWLEESGGFWAVLSLMGLTVASSLMLLHWRKFY